MAECGGCAGKAAAAQARRTAAAASQGVTGDALKPFVLRGPNGELEYFDTQAAARAVNVSRGGRGMVRPNRYR